MTATMTTNLPANSAQGDKNDFAARWGLDYQVAHNLILVLESLGVAKAIGKRTTGQRGKPATIYQIDNLDDIRLNLMGDPDAKRQPKAKPAKAETVTETAPVVAETVTEAAPVVVAETVTETAPVVVAETVTETAPVVAETVTEAAPVVVETVAETGKRKRKGKKANAPTLV